MSDLSTLQYPRHVHRHGAYQIVRSEAECDAALDAGWVLRPGDPPRVPQTPDEIPDNALSEGVSDSLIDQTPAEASAVPQKRGRGRPKMKG